MGIKPAGAPRNIKRTRNEAEESIAEAVVEGKHEKSKLSQMEGVKSAQRNRQFSSNQAKAGASKSGRTNACPK